MLSRLKLNLTGSKFGLVKSVIRQGVGLCISTRSFDYMHFSSMSINDSTKPVMKAETFSFPKPTTSVENVNLHVPQQDIDDFNITRLVHGTTDRCITISESASIKLDEISTLDNNDNTALKITVESGGCHGFQYTLNLCDFKEEMAKQDDENLLIFKRNDGRKGCVILNDSSLEILQHSKIEYSKELIGSSFKVVDSPYTSAACGCGASFDFDFDKLEEETAKRKAKKDRRETIGGD